MHLPHLVFSHKQLDLFLWLLWINNVDNVPSTKSLNLLNKILQNSCGIDKLAYKGKLGHHYHVNSMAQILAQVCFHLCFHVPTCCEVQLRRFAIHKFVHTSISILKILERNSANGGKQNDGWKNFDLKKQLRWSTSMEMTTTFMNLPFSRTSWCASPWGLIILPIIDCFAFENKEMLVVEEGEVVDGNDRASKRMCSGLPKPQDCKWNSTDFWSWVDSWFEEVLPCIICSHHPGQG